MSDEYTWDDIVVEVQSVLEEWFDAVHNGSRNRREDASNYLTATINWYRGTIYYERVRALVDAIIAEHFEHEPL